MSTLSNRTRRSRDIYWPGFVDALSALLIVVIFLIMVFVLAQFFLSEALSGRDEALLRLNRQINELGRMLDLERGVTSDLRLTVTQLSAELQSSLTEEEGRTAQIAALRLERDTFISEREALARKLAAVEQDLAAARLGADTAATEADKSRAELEDAFIVIDADREKIELQLTQLESLRRDIVALSTVRDDLEGQVVDLAKSLDVTKEELIAVRADNEELDAELTTVRDRTKELEARLADEEERTALAQRDLDERAVRLRELLTRAEAAELGLDSERAISAEAKDVLALLNLQLSELRTQIAALNDVLEASEAKNVEQEVVIADLGRRLNLALVAKVEELARYRSEFFGRLREVLGDRDDVRIVGDRFVFQSEVLFASGEAHLEDEGRGQLLRLARALREISESIPAEIDWVVRIDGHTDVRPISTAQFPSNWELSAARAISVVRFMVEQGIPARRMIAAGFGEFNPLDRSLTEEAFRRNRRIEFKLTQR